MTTSVNRGYIPEIDQIRGYAALLVLFYHGLNLFSQQMLFGVLYAPAYRLQTINPIMAFVYEGHSGVGLFIVLSGFILTMGCVGRKIDYGKFLLSRILRLYPLYVFFLAFAVCANRDGFNFSSIVQTLLQFSNFPGGPASNLTSMFWAVSVEFQCYLVFPFLIMFSDTRGNIFLLGVMLLALIFRALLVLDGANARDLSYWTVAGRIDQFVLGIIAARIYVLHDLRSALKPWWVLVSTSLVVIAMFLYHRSGGWIVTANWKIFWPPIEAAFWAFFIVTYLAAGRLIPAMIAKMATRVGEISYSIYLVHFIVSMLIVKYQWFTRISGNPYYDALITTLVLAAPITISIASLSYVLIEAPFLALRKPYIVPHGDGSVQAG
ncbi:acyltransferase family protein [uncultured Bradyrhizobium sp.]|uniref:acyltransferase family protein n=1 Tax=uncultured Bradyrhizobium sp. TaxID=199684 RepID=UPI0035CBEB6F